MKVSPQAWPDLTAAARSAPDGLRESLERSLGWFAKPSSRKYFPVGDISHERAHASVYAFREVFLRAASAADLAEALRNEFEIYSSVGWDGRGTVLFTGYYSPTFAGSRTSSDTYRYPLYKRPDDLVSDPATGEVLGRQVGDRIVPYPTRAEIESSRMLAGLELVWLRDRFDRYLIHVQGSAVLALTDGSTMRVSYAGNNGYGYTSVARLLVADGKLREDELSVENVRRYLTTDPDELEKYLLRNDRYIFFRAADGLDWPTGSLGVKVTASRTLATDKRLFPAGSVALVVTRLSRPNGRARRFVQFMLDQDTGGAIRSPGRADIYFGIGEEAGKVAGGQYEEGRLYYLMLKRERVSIWLARLRGRG